MIRSSAHSLKFANKGKRQAIEEFLAEYRRLLQVIIDDVWQNGIPGLDVDIAKNRLSIPSFLPNDHLKTFDSWFTARMKQCVGKQACAMLKAATKKRKKQLWMLRKLQREGEPHERLQSKIGRQLLRKPNASNAKAELDPRFIDFQVGSTEFDVFVRVKTIGNGMMLKIPVKETKPSRKWSKQGTRKQSIRLSTDYLWFIYDVPDVEKTPGRIVGLDQGMRTVATLSDGQETMPCPHGHTLESIMDVLRRRKSGGKGFQRAQEHRKNYINWSLNQLVWSDIGEVRLERIKNLRHGRRNHNKMIHWTYTEIKRKVVSLSEAEGFVLKEVSSAFRSQRCNQCGWVQKANRKGKTFQCRNCSHEQDADRNAASNLELNLPEIPNWVCWSKKNRGGFFWLSHGLFSVSHEPIVRDAQRALA